MKEIKVDTKLIFIAIGISFLIGTLIWCGYSIYIQLTKDENEGIENFQEDMSLSKIESIGIIKSDIIDDKFFIQPNIEKKFSINNENYVIAPEDWGKEIFWSKESNAEYNFPLTFKELLGINLVSAVLDMSDWTEDGTYEDFLEDFTDQIRHKIFLEEAEYTTRPINIGGKEFKIVMIKSEDIIGSYFCLAKDGYAYCIQAIIPKFLYTELWEQNIDKIFSTFRIN